MAPPKLDHEADSLGSLKAIEEKSTLNRADFKAFVSQIHDYLKDNHDDIPKCRSVSFKKKEWKEFATAYIKANHQAFSKKRSGFVSADHFFWPDHDEDLAYLAFAVMKVEKPKAARKRRSEVGQENGTATVASAKKQKTTDNSSSATHQKEEKAGKKSQRVERHATDTESDDSEEDVQEVGTPPPKKQEQTKPDAPTFKETMKTDAKKASKNAESDAASDTGGKIIKKKSQEHTYKETSSDSLLESLRPDLLILSDSQLMEVRASFSPAQLLVIKRAAAEGDDLSKLIFDAKKSHSEVDEDKDVQKDGIPDKDVMRIAEGIADSVPGLALARVGQKANEVLAKQHLSHEVGEMISRMTSETSTSTLPLRPASRNCAKSSTGSTTPQEFEIPVTDEEWDHLQTLIQQRRSAGFTASLESGEVSPQFLLNIGGTAQGVSAATQTNTLGTESTVPHIVKSLVLTLQISLTFIPGSTPFMVNITTETDFAEFMGRLFLKSDASVVVGLRQAKKIVFVLNKFGADPQESEETPSQEMTSKPVEILDIEMADKDNDHTEVGREASERDLAVSAGTANKHDDHTTFVDKALKEMETSATIKKPEVPEELVESKTLHEIKTSAKPIISGKRVLDLTEKDEDREIMWKRILQAVACSIRHDADKIVEAEFEV